MARRERRRGLERAGPRPRQIAGDAKTMQFKLARAMARRRFDGLAEMLAADGRTAYRQTRSMRPEATGIAICNRVRSGSAGREKEHRD